MKNVINVQIRLLVGCAALYLVALLIFGEALLVYKVADVIRWSIYIVGASLVITTVGWPGETLGVIREFYSTLMTKVLEIKPPKLGTKDFIQSVRALLKNVSGNGRKTEYIVMQFYELLDVAETIITGNGFKSPVEELNHRFYWENLPSKSDVVWEDVILDGRSQRVPVFIAHTVE